MYWVIDRFEGDYAILENTKTRETEAYLHSTLPKNARPGSVLIRHETGWEIDQKETAARSKRIKDLFALLKKKNGY